MRATVGVDLSDECASPSFAIAIVVRRVVEDGDDESGRVWAEFVCVFCCLRGSNLFSLVFWDLDVV